MVNFRGIENDILVNLPEKKKLKLFVCHLSLSPTQIMSFVFFNLLSYCYYYYYFSLSIYIYVQIPVQLKTFKYCEVVCHLN